MKALKILGAIIGSIAVLLIIVGLVAPDSGQVERSIVIDDTPSAIYKELNSFDSYNHWSPWFTRDPNAKYTYEGPDSGVGAIMKWESENPDVGSGSQEIIASEKDQKISYKLDFGVGDGYYADFVLQEIETGHTKVTWVYRYEDINMVGALFGLVFSAEEMVGQDYEKGLKALKAYIEG